MRFEHTVVVPLSLPDARRLLDELERRIPVLPGLVVRVELAVIDPRSTSVQLRGELPGITGRGSALLVETGMRLLRRYADQVVAVARERGAEARRRTTASPSETGVAGARNADGRQGDSSVPRDSYTFGARPGQPAGEELKRLRDEPVVWALGALGMVLLVRGLRRR